MQRKDGLVTQGIFEGVAAHVSVFVLLGSKGPEGIVVRFVDRRTRQSKEESIGQCQAHPLAQVSLLSTMCLVHHNDDVFPLVDVRLGILELENGSDDNIA